MVGNQQQPEQQSEARRNRQAGAAQVRRYKRRRGDHPLRLPWWSLVLLFMAVTGTSFAIVAAILTVGGNLAPANEPQIIIITAEPSRIPTGRTQLATPTIPAQFLITPLPSVSFLLSGPTLEAVPLSPTPIPITVGALVTVSNVAGDGLNVRSDAGITNRVLFIADEGTTFRVIDGPVADSGLTWWQVQDIFSPDQVGWAASNFLELQPEAATPTP